MLKTKAEVIDLLNSLGCLESDNVDGYNILIKQKELKEVGVNIDLVFFNPETRAFEYVLDFESDKFKVEVYKNGNSITLL